MASLPPINRQTTTPFLLKLYYNLTPLPTDIPTPPSSPSYPHVDIYTWADCTLRELASLLSSALPAQAGLAAHNKLVFRLCYADTKAGRYKVSEMGTVEVPVSGNDGADGEDGKKQLREMGFIQGDWVIAGVGGVTATGGGRGGGARARVPSGEWKRGERVEEERWGGGGGSGGGGRRGGGWGRRGGRW